MAQKRFSDNPEYFVSTQSGTYELDDDDILPLSHDPAGTNTDGKVTVAELAKKVAVDSVADGNMNPVTSNAVYDAMNAVETGTDGILSWAKTGRLLKFVITGQMNDGNSFTLPYRPVMTDAGLIFWGDEVVGYFSIQLDGTILANITFSPTGNGFISGTAIV